MQQRPSFFNTETFRAEEQLAFHEMYHDRLARLTGGIDAAAGWDKKAQGEFSERPPDHWAEYTRRFEQMGGGERLGEEVSQREGTLPMTSSPRRHGLDTSQNALLPLSKKLEEHSTTKSLARVPEGSVLQRLEWLAQEKGEPDTTDVIDLLRDVEDALVSEENQKNERPHLYDAPQRPVGISLDPPSSLPHSFVATNAHSANSNTNTSLYCNRGAPPPPPATTPTAAPSFQHMTQGAVSSNMPGVMGWSWMSQKQQMEWYRVYYAWMMYYAQYYGAILASQRQQLQQPLHQPEKVVKKNTNRQQTNLKELSRESKELAEEVERLKQNFWDHVSSKNERPCFIEKNKLQSKRLQRRLPHQSHTEAEGEDTLYRSDNGYSYLFAGSTSTPPPPPSIQQAAFSSKEIQRPKKLVQKESPNNRCRSTSAVIMSKGKGNEAAQNQRCDFPWLQPRRRGSAEQLGKSADQAAHRDISWLYKYEESEGEAGSSTNTEDELEPHPQDGTKRKNSQDLEEIRAYVPSRKSRQDTHPQQQQPKQGGRLSIYERKRRELELENPPWRF